MYFILNSVFGLPSAGGICGNEKRGEGAGGPPFLLSGGGGCMRLFFDLQHAILQSLYCH